MSDVRITALNSITAIDGWLKALAGNLTGSTVNGFRQTRVQFEDVLATQIRGGTPAGGGFQSINPIQFSSGGTAIKATRTDFSQGALNSTQRPTDLALKGNGFFVLSKVKEPRSAADLVFTRNGSFTLEYEQDFSIIDANSARQLGPNPILGRLNLVSQEGYYVMGISGEYRPSTTVGQPGLTVPPRDFPALAGVGADDRLGALTSPQGGGGIGFKAFSFPILKDSNLSKYNVNADLVGRLIFNRNGQMIDSNKQEVPLSTDTLESGGQLFLDPVTGTVRGAGNYNKYVAVASFVNPDGLNREAGTAFTWAPAVGNFTVGAAGNDEEPIGSTNEIAPGNLEAANSSVNTTLPELTIAQKSFTAQVKIVSVGNTLIDDVNQLIR